MIKILKNYANMVALNNIKIIFTCFLHYRFHIWKRPRNSQYHIGRKRA